MATLLIITLNIPLTAQASTDQENATLAQLINEIALLEVLIRDAQHSAVKNDRQRFDYAALRRDIALISQGVNNHLTMKRRDPRSLVQQVQGEYRQ